MLDGLGFKCKIVEINDDGTLKLEFEDGFVEEEVPREEVQAIGEGEGAAAPAEVQEVGSAQVVTEPLEVEPKKSELYLTTALWCDRYPLIEFALCTCCECLSAKKDMTYVVHGSENNVAAGSGLKGVRWLRSQT